MKKVLLFVLQFCLVFPTIAQFNTGVLPWERVASPPCCAGQVAVQQATIFVATGCGLYKSTDNGDSWALQPDVPQIGIVSIVANDSVILVMQYMSIPNWSYFINSFQLYRSVDAGTTFQQVSEVYPPASPSNPYDFEKEIYERNDSTFYIEGKKNLGGFNNMVFLHFVSKDYGATWAAVEIPSPAWSDFQQMAFQDDTIFVYRQDSLAVCLDDSLMSIETNPVPPQGWSVNSYLLKGIGYAIGKIYLCMQNGTVLITSNHGIDWSLDSLTLGEVSDFSFFDGNFYLCTTEGLFSTSDLSLSLWDTLYFNPLPLKETNNVTLINNRFFITSKGLLLRSDDNGSTWQKKSESLGESNASEIYALGDTLILWAVGGYHLSTDGGLSWELWENPVVYQRYLTGFFKHNNYWYAFRQYVNNQGSKIAYRSVDNGLTWKPTVDSLVLGYSKVLHNSNRLHIGLFYSDDDGDSWQSISSAPGQIVVAEGDTLVTVNQQHIYLSKNNGLNWQEIFNPFSFGSYAPMIVVKQSEKLVVIVEYSYVSSTEDWGQTWDTEFSGLTPQRLNSYQVLDNFLFVNHGFYGELMYLYEDRVKLSGVSPTPFYYQIIWPGMNLELGIAYGMFAKSGDWVYVAGKGVWRVKSCQFEAQNKREVICEGSELVIGADTLTQAGEYILPATDPDICDSTFTLRLTVVQSFHSNLGTTICHGDSLYWNGIPYSQAGLYSQGLSAYNGCDSLVHLHLNTLPPIKTDIDTLLESGVPFGGVLFTNDTTLVELFTAANGCDSTVTTHVTVLTATKDVFGGKVSVRVFPNPFSSDFTVKFTLSKSTSLTATLYDALGRRVAVLLENEAMGAGEHELVFPQKDLPPGFYLLHFQADGKSLLKKLVKW